MKRADNRRYFQLRPDRKRQVVQLDARHRWVLPGVCCDVCRETWAVTGLDYPTIDLSSFKDREALTAGRVVTTDQYAQLSQQLADVLRGRPHLPGTELGPLVGTASGTPEDFEWLNPWTLLLEERTMAVLREKQLSLPEVIPAALDGLRGRFVELELLPYGGVEAVPKGKACPRCGRTVLRLNGRPVLRKRSLDQHPDLFRISNFPTLVIATEKLVASIKMLKLGGCSLIPVDLR